MLAGSVLDEHSIVTLDGQVMLGAVLSNTVMSWVQLEELPHASVETYRRVILKRLTQVESDMTSPPWVTVTVPQLSLDVTLWVETEGTSEAHDTVRLAGHTIDGGVLSSTTMVCAHVLELPQSSVAVHTLVMVRSCGQPPATVTSENVMAGL